METTKPIQEIVASQRAFFNSTKTQDVTYRINQLKKLRNSIMSYENEILDALKKDLHKPDFEGYTTEIMQVLNEIRYVIRHLKKWARPRKVKTPLELFPATSRIYPQPYGVVLNMSPWNYPFQLCLLPLVSILAAGNCAVLKPSEYAVHTSALITRLIREIYDPEYCTVVEGGIAETQELLKQKWDFIAFTGSPAVARIVSRSVAESLTPLLLELGGKSPCIVHADADVKGTARRIAWGKFLNAGQTCIAPDYVVADRRIASTLVDELKAQLMVFYGANPKASPDYCRIIHRKHFDRLAAYLDQAKIVYGGDSDADDLYIAPTILYKTDWEDPVMQEEIFGPFLPVLEYDDPDALISRLQTEERPLAVYVFTKNKKLQERIIRSLPFGGGSINHTVLHSANFRLPFGGVGNSGMGRYHGKTGFDTFSYQKSMLIKPLGMDTNLIYPPYKQKLKLIKKIV